MQVSEIMEKIDLKNFQRENVYAIKKNKLFLSNTEKKELVRIWTRSKKESKETILKSVICFAIWNPDDAIETARKKGLFRYKVFGIEKKENPAKYYLDFFVDHSEIFGFSMYTQKYLLKKSHCEWLTDFYSKAEKKIDLIMKNHYKKRIRKRIHNVNYESSLYKELLTYIDICFLFEFPTNKEAGPDSLSFFSKEEISEGVSYLLFKYMNDYGISQNKNYIIDTMFVQSCEIEQLVLYACQVNYILGLELMIDFCDYDVLEDGKKIIIKSKDASFEKSMRLAYITHENQEATFYNVRFSEMYACGNSLSQFSKLVVNVLEGEIIKEKSNILQKYILEIPDYLLDKIAEQNTEGKIELYTEEYLEVSYFANQRYMTKNELAQKKLTEHCNIFDILLCQRYFRFLFYIQKFIYEKMLSQKSTYEKEKIIKIIFQSLIPLTEKRKLLQIFTKLLNDSQKAKEVFSLLEYNSKFKLDLQYTPFINIGKNVSYSISILANSKLIRNVIAYSYLSKNKIVNNDNRLEPLVKKCKNCFKHCQYSYAIYTNKKYTYKGRNSEIDVLAVSESEIVIIECKDPLMPASNFEMRATLEHIQKASKQLDYSKEAFEDDGFRNKFFIDALKIDGKRRKVYTCIILSNQLFSSWSGSRHPIRYIEHLDIVLNHGNLPEWHLWKNEIYSCEDLIDFLTPKGKFTSIMNNSMEKYYDTMTIDNKNIFYESYRLN